MSTFKVNSFVEEPSFDNFISNWSNVKKLFSLKVKSTTINFDNVDAKCISYTYKPKGKSKSCNIYFLDAKPILSKIETISYNIEKEIITKDDMIFHKEYSHSYDLNSIDRDITKETAGEQLDLFYKQFIEDIITSPKRYLSITFDELLAWNHDICIAIYDIVERLNSKGELTLDFNYRIVYKDSSKK